jgi:hypothetical protein
MTVSIGNLRATWANAGVKYTGLGLNVNASSYDPDSSILKISLNNQEKLKLAANGLLYISGNLITSNGTVVSGNTDISPAWNTANAAYTIAVSAFDTANAASGNAGTDIAVAAFDKANAANVLAFNTGIGANAYAASVGTAGNTYTLATIAGANTAVGAGANTVSVAAFTKANTSLANGFIIYASGNNVGIGIASPTQKLDVSGNVKSSDTVFATHFDNVSDVSLKKNIQKIGPALNIVEQLSPVSFQWKNNHQKSFGLIAQEVEKILPSIVHHNGEVKTINYIELIAFLIAAIQEQNTELKVIRTMLDNTKQEN